LFLLGETGGILISRIPHQRMLTDRQGIDDEDDTPDFDVNSCRRLRNGRTGHPRSIFSLASCATGVAFGDADQPHDCRRDADLQAAS
jgi:hypothetical protein